MAIKKKKGVPLFSASRLDDLDQLDGYDGGQLGEGSGSKTIDISSLAAVLSSEYPLIDTSLILAILSDYPPEQLDSQLGNIRDQLGILEATLVPDPDDIPLAIEESESISEHFSGFEDLTLVERGDVAESSFKQIERSHVDELAPAATPLSASSRSGKSSTSQSSNGTKFSSPLSDQEETGFTDELDMLMSLFAALPQGDIEGALTSEGSVEAAIDYLLSVELVREVETNGYWPGESNDTASESEDPDQSWRLVLKPTKSREQTSGNSTPHTTTPPSESTSSLPALLLPTPIPKYTAKRKKDKRIIPVIDTLQRKPSPRPSSASSSRGSSPSRASSVNTSRPSPNAWHAIASLAAYLSDLLPQPHTYFLGYLHSPEYHHPYHALRASLAHISPIDSRDKENDSEMGIHAEEVLQAIYGVSLLADDGSDTRTRMDLEICVNAAGHDVAVVMDLMELLADVKTWPGDEDIWEEINTPPITALRRNLPVLPIGTATIDSSSNFASPLASNDATTIPLPKNEIPSTASTPANRNAVKSKIKKAVPAEPKERYIPGSKPTLLSFAHPTAYDAFGLPSSSTKKAGKASAAAAAAAGKQNHPQNYRKVTHIRPPPRTRQLHPLASHIPSYARGSTPQDPTPGSLYTSTIPGELTIEECYRRAAAERSRRELAIRDVGKHWSSSAPRLSGKNKSLGGAIAGHYASEARNAMDKAKEWELKAARMVVEAQLRSTGHTIDLHHMTVLEASTVALEAVDRWYTKFQEGRKGVGGQGGSMIIVTGVGRHSVGQRGVLGPAVANVLEEAGWRVDRGENARGYLVVKGRK